MSIYRGNQCIVFLAGHVSAMPVMMPNYSTNFAMTVTRKFFSSHSNQVIENQFYRVILTQQDAVKILQYGYLGISLLVRGDLRIHETTEIIAEQIDFIDFSSSSSLSNTVYSQKFAIKTHEKIDNEKILMH
ncbi:MAG: hypothetical protein COY58_01725 [Gammaproteobacteria bacterium CG_4_10_14_0_8_um_filter_38_16]|nr:MAG: hypothetical protein COY58_01725 [Gammaproteobacteria bacterium CG_4_10_14_0_8_um_filter_38_16]PJA03983.1 MAG: hypothetical protein COX72_02410 [Gammaproteobacteria bacterium CG_4_10_14_0_2_um_filter_38_22]PJB10547.1 MAG: hypothetical protein CO120_04265 [Gammaproteobacteria bacterium CG_4_9_14_3_um_filter_38_9]